MKITGWFSFVSGGLLCLFSDTNLSLGQSNCGCGGQTMNSGTMYYESAGMGFESMGSSGALGPEALLEVADNPSEIINLTVVVQEKAIVAINGEPTVTKGMVRPYIVRGLKAGKQYEFTIAGLVKEESGAVYAAIETVKLTAGETKQVVLHLRRKNRPEPDPAAPANPPVAPKV